MVAAWPGWGAEGEPHLLSPLDVVRREDGHDVALPVLSERLDRLLERRDDAGSPLSPGEAVTLAVSIVRGLAASVRRNPDEAGQWWLGEDGRPTLVEGIGESAARGDSAEALSTLAASMPRTRLGAVLTTLAEALDDGAFPRDALAWEDRLFDLAPPEPLVTEVLGPLRARSVTATPPDVGSPTTEQPRRSWWERLISHVDADLAETVSDTLTRVARRARSGTTGRRRPLLWAAGIALVVVVGGMLWPTGSDETVVTAERTPVASSPPATPSPAADQGAPADPVAAASALLDARRTCTDAACAGTELEGPARAVPPGVVDAAGEARRVSLVDDLGGLVVVRIESLDGSMPLQLATIVDTTNGWRIRDVYDVTDAPS